MAVGISPNKLQTVAHTPSDLQSQAVIGRGAGRDERRESILIETSGVIQWYHTITTTENCAQVYCRSVQGGLRRHISDVRGQVQSRSRQSRKVDNGLHVEMNSSSADVAHFNGVVVPEAVLDTQGPIQGLRILHVWRIVRRSSCSSRGGTRKRCNPSRSRWQAAIGQKVRNVGCKGRSVFRNAQLRWQRQNTDVVVVDVIRDSEAAADRRLATGAGRIGKSHTRSPVVLGSAGLIKYRDARHGGEAVQALRPNTEWCGGVFVTHAEVQSEVLLYSPVVVYEPIQSRLVAVIGGLAYASLPQNIRAQVVQILLQGIVFVVAPRSLGERLRRDVLATLNTYFHSMFVVRPADVVG